MGLKEWIIPQEKVFFELLGRQSQNVAEASQVLREMFEDFSQIEEKRKRLKEIEHAGDGIVHDLYYKLNETLVTPIDHSDIARLASLYDDVLDYMFATAHRVYLYQIARPTPAMLEFARIIAQQVEHINRAMASIKEMKKEEMEQNCVEIHRLENEADDLLYRELPSLFKLKNPMDVIKLKEIYEYLEIITDKCEDVSNVLMDIRMKYG